MVRFTLGCLASYLLIAVWAAGWWGDGTASEPRAFLDQPMVLDSTAKVQLNPDIRRLDLSKLVFTYGHEGSGVSRAVLRRNDPSRPLVFLTFMLDHARCHPHVSPACFRVPNFLCHVVNAVLVGLLARAWLGTSHVAAWSAGAAFMLSPANWATAMYVYGRSDVLSTLFVLVAVIVVVRGASARTHAAQHAQPVHHTTAVRPSVVPACALCLGLLCKQTVVVAPVLVVAVVSTRHARLCWGALRSVAPALGDATVAVVVYAAGRCLLFGGFGDLEAQSLPPLVGYWCSQPYAWLRYARTMIVPSGLAIDHHLIVGDMVAESVAGLVAVPAIACLARLLWLHMSNETKTEYGASLAWFTVCMLPFSVVPTVDVYVERRMYLASVLVYIVAVHGVHRVCSMLWSFGRDAGASGKPCTRSARILAFALLMAAVLGAWGTVCKDRTTGVFRTEVGVWREVLRQYPTSVRGLNNLATALMRAGRHDEAEPYLDALVAMHPTDWIAVDNLASIAQHQGDLERARALYTRVITSSQHNAHAMFRLATVYHQQNRMEEAEQLYKQAMELDPTIPDLHNNLALLLLHTARIDDGRRVLDAGLAMHPDDPLLASTRRLFE